MRISFNVHRSPFERHSCLLFTVLRYVQCYLLQFDSFHFHSFRLHFFNTKSQIVYSHISFSFLHFRSWTSKSTSCNAISEINPQNTPFDSVENWKFSLNINSLMEFFIQNSLIHRNEKKIYMYDAGYVQRSCLASKIIIFFKESTHLHIYGVCIQKNQNHQTGNGAINQNGP